MWPKSKTSDYPAPLFGPDQLQKQTFLQSVSRELPHPGKIPHTGDYLTFRGVGIVAPTPKHPPFQKKVFLFMVVFVVFVIVVVIFIVVIIFVVFVIIVIVVILILKLRS